MRRRIKVSPLIRHISKVGIRTDRKPVGRPFGGGKLKMASAFATDLFVDQGCVWKRHDAARIAKATNVSVETARDAMDRVEAGFEAVQKRKLVGN